VYRVVDNAVPDVCDGVKVHVGAFVFGHGVQTSLGRTGGLSYIS
jgi:hypothetical protein